jgi:kynurenine formamidase
MWLGKQSGQNACNEFRRGNLRKHKRSRFLLTAPPLRMPGAAGSPVTPVATV